MGQRMRVIPPIVFSLVMLALAGCGERPLTLLPADGTILAFGDSLTEGVGAPSGQGYPERLEELSGYRVVNAGVSGETTGEGLARFPSVLEATRPDLVILLEGGNDILRNKGKGKIRSNLAAMIELAQGQDIPVVLLGVPEKSLFSDSANLYEELALEYALVFSDDLVADLLRSLDLKSDAVHLNSDGYREMAEQVHELLRDAGALP